MTNATLWDHLTAYGRHRREATRHPEMARDLSKLLRRSTNPVTKKELTMAYMRQLSKEDSIRWFGRNSTKTAEVNDHDGLFDEQESTTVTEDGQTVPSWLLEDIEEVPTPIKAPPKPQRLLHVPEYVPTPVRSLTSRAPSVPTPSPVKTPAPVKAAADPCQKLVLPSGETVTIFVTPPPPKQTTVTASSTPQRRPSTLDFLASPPSYTAVPLDDLLPSTTDKADPLMTSTDNLTAFLEEIASAPLTTQPEHHSRILKNSTSQTSTINNNESETQTEETVQGQILSTLQRLSKTADEFLKTTIQTQRNNQAILEEMQRIERKVTHIYREMTKEEDCQPPPKRFRSDQPRTEKKEVKSVVKKIN